MGESGLPSTVSLNFLATVLPGGAGVRVGMDKSGQAGDTGEGALRIFRTVESEAEFFFNAEGELERVGGVQAEVAANQWFAVGYGVRIGDVRPEKVGDQMLQSRR